MRLTVYLLIANGLFFIVQLLLPAFTDLFALTPVDALSGAFWQFFTYMFLHADISHIALNMFALMMFGPLVEESLGRQRFLLLYFLAGLGSAALHIASIGTASTVLLLGASGAVFGIVTAYGLLFPRNIIWFWVPMPAIVAVIGFIAFEFVAGVLDLFPGVASFGHLGGILTSLGIMSYWKFTSKNKRIEIEKDFHYFWQ